MRPLLGEWSRGAVQAIAVSSGEGLANLARLLGEAGPAMFAGTPLFVPHARVVAQARSLGAAEVVIAGAADEEVLAALVAYFRSTG
jgi:uroporphyrinogen-III synthase